MSAIREWLKQINHQTQAIFALLLIVAAIPQIYPIALPVTVSTQTKAFYDTIQNLPAGSTILMCTAYQAGHWGEQGGPSIAIVNQLIHLKDRNFKLVFTPLSSLDGGLLIQKYLALVQGGQAALGTYGVDWVILPYIAARTAYASLMAAPDGIWKTCGNKDYLATDFSQLPMMATIQDHTRY